jgi:hypothetical protein
MKLTLKCTHITPHADGTQTVSLTRIPGDYPEPQRPAPGRPAKAQTNVIVEPGFPIPSGGTPTSILITNWRNGQPFTLNALYSVDIEKG